MTRNSRRSRLRRSVVIMVLVVGCLLMPLGLAALAEPQTRLRRDSSGLLLISHPDYSIPDDLQDAYSLARRLSEENPDEFGYPTAGSTSQQVLIPATGVAGRTAAAAAGDGNYEPIHRLLQSGGELRKFAPVPANADELLSKQIRWSDGGRSWREAEAVHHQVFDLAISPDFASAHAWQSAIDPATSNVNLWVESLTPALATAIVQTFGTELVSVTIEKQPDI